MATGLERRRKREAVPANQSPTVAGDRRLGGQTKPRFHIPQVIAISTVPKEHRMKRTENSSLRDVL